MATVYSKIKIINVFVYQRNLFTITSEKELGKKLYYHTVVVERSDEQGKIEFYLKPTYRLPYPSSVYRKFLLSLYPLMPYRKIKESVKEFNYQYPSLRLNYK